jgi:hypothetical protein
MIAERGAAFPSINIFPHSLSSFLSLIYASLLFVGISIPHLPYNGSLRL